MISTRQFPVKVFLQKYLFPIILFTLDVVIWRGGWKWDQKKIYKMPPIEVEKQGVGGTL